MQNKQNQTNSQNHSLSTNRIAAASAVAISALTLLLSGCGIGGSGTSTTAVSTTPHVTKVSGIVHGGQQPIAFSTVQLFQVAVGPTGTQSSNILTAPVISDINGNFTLTGLYPCTANSMVYLVATGGQPGPVAPANSAIGMMTGLGSCVALQSTPFVSINEVTTVASVYALAGFMTDYTHVSYVSGNLSGLTNAFATENVLVSPSVGVAYGPTGAAGITLPNLKINSLADSISACINSPSTCSTLFTAATPSGGTAPTDTLAAVVNIAHNTAMTTANVQSIFGLAPSQSPFQNQLTVAPADWTMSIAYTGGGLSLPNGIAIDATGNAWIANEGGNAITKLSSGAFLSGSTGFTSTSIVGPQAVAADFLGNIYVANTGANNILQLNAAGAITNTLSAGISGPVALAIDATNDVWVSNFNSNSIAAFSPSGSALSGSPFTNAALTAPTGIAIAPNNGILVSNSNPGNVAAFSNAGAFIGTGTDGLLVAPGGIAVDPNLGKVVAAGTGINALTVLTGTGPSSFSGTTYSGAGVSLPLAVAIDSASNIWTVSDATAGSISAFTSTGTALTGTSGIGTLNQPTNLAIDASGNLWTTNIGDNSVTQFIGLSAPTVTPLAP